MKGGTVKKAIMISYFLMIMIVIRAEGQITLGERSDESTPGNNSSMAAFRDSISDLTSLLNDLALNSDNELFKLHCTSIINVIEAVQNLSADEVSFLRD